MTRCDWIVCERSNRWAPALRTALNSRPGHDLAAIALHEVRKLDELSNRLGELPHGLALLEVTPKNLDAILTWLALATRGSAKVGPVALLDRGFVDPGDAASALREAGALEIAQSPRRLQHVLQLECRYAARRGVGNGRQLEADQSIETWAWSLLPWQDTRRPVG